MRRIGRRNQNRKIRIFEVRIQHSEGINRIIEMSRRCPVVDVALELINLPSWSTWASRHSFLGYETRALDPPFGQQNTRTQLAQKTSANNRTDRTRSIRSKFLHPSSPFPLMKHIHPPPPFSPRAVPFATALDRAPYLEIVC